MAAKDKKVTANNILSYVFCLKYKQTHMWKLFSYIKVSEDKFRNKKLQGVAHLFHMVNGEGKMEPEFGVLNFLLLGILDYALLSSFNLILDVKGLTDVYLY